MENTYDRKEFFEKYSQMERSVKGLEGAGEWHELQKLLPDFSGKRVLDLGCGFAGTAGMQWKKGLPMFWGSILQKICWPGPGDDGRHPGGIQAPVYGRI